jgi:hypothetical protein
MWPFNILVTFLLHICLITFVPGSEQGDGFFMPGSAIVVPLLVFAGLFILGIPLAILGMIMILLGERKPRYVVVASIGLAANLLPLIVLGVLYLIN